MSFAKSLLLLFAAQSLEPTAKAFTVQAKVENLDLRAELTEDLTLEKKSPTGRFEIQQDCPNPDLMDVTKGLGWNNLELGIGFRLGAAKSEPFFYTKYTCPAPGQR